jgi:hypothetical protein
MSNRANKYGYSDKLFDRLFTKIQEELNALCKDKQYSFQGLWAFAYLEGANSLQSVYFNHANIDGLKSNYKEVLEEIKKTRLDCDYGSLGFSFSNNLINNSEIVDFLENTYNDAKGTVCYYDVVIKQKHAYFVLIKNEFETLGVLDFFFDGNLTSDCQNAIKTYFKENFENINQSNYQNDFNSVFKIWEYEYFLELQTESNNTGNAELNIELGSATKYIENLLSASSKTPLLLIKHKKGNYLPELVALNFDFIHSIIKHEHRFCPITDAKNCFHFDDYKEFQSESLQCFNEFLTKYYYEVFKALKACKNSFEFVVNYIGYTVDIVCSGEMNCSPITSLDVNSIEAEINNENLTGTASEKYQDERVYLEIDKLLNQQMTKVYAFSLSREANPHLKFSSKCREINVSEADCKIRNKCISTNPKDSIKQFISPSTILPIQHKEKEHDLLERIDTKAKNIVHFKITNEKEYTNALKTLIAKNPEGYKSALTPYLSHNNDIGNSAFPKNLSINFVGEDPLKENKFSEVILGKLNLIEALLQEEEVKIQARKAAIAQVMLRNMSHNIGSHVLANLTQPKTILDLGKENNHDNLLPQEIKLTFKNESDITELKFNIKPGSLDVAIAELNSYMRTRMDFLADISTGTAVIEISKNLAQDVIEPFEDRAFLIKKYITGNNKKVKIQNPKNVIAAFPNDNLGIQALYVIIENVIRNSAKHSKSGKSVLINWICNEDIAPNLIEIVIYDENDTKEESELIALIAEQNERINKEMLDNGVLRHGSWGMLEMKIAAAYLRKIPVENIDNLTIEPRLLTAVPVSEKKGKYLGYKFYLLKPQNVLIITNEEVILSDEFKKHGIYSISKSKLSTSKDTFGQDLVLLSDLNLDSIINYKKRFSQRVICLDKDEELEQKLELQPTDFIHWAWELWFKQLLDKTQPVTVKKNDDETSLTNEVQLKKPSNTDNPSGNAVFVYHCKTYHESEQYFEPYGSLHPAVTQINKLFNNPEISLKAQFLETINYTVAIADERVQKQATTSFDGGINGCNKKHSDFLVKCGIHVPPEEIDLNAESFDTMINIDSEEQCIKQHLKNWCETMATTCDFLVIHIGILERLLDLDREKDENKQRKIQNYLAGLRNLSNRKAKFIITSGRGQPESLPKGERFIHYSNIAQYVIEKRSKFHLIQLLMSARETK